MASLNRSKLVTRLKYSMKLSNASMLQCVLGCCWHLVFHGGQPEWAAKAGFAFWESSLPHTHSQHSDRRSCWCLPKSLPICNPLAFRYGARTAKQDH